MDGTIFILIALAIVFIVKLIISEVNHRETQRKLDNIQQQIETIEQDHLDCFNEVLKLLKAPSVKQQTHKLPEQHITIKH